MNSEQLFFIALLPPQAIQDYATGIKLHFAQRFSSRHALKSPPHITLQPPFKWRIDREQELNQSIATFAQTQAPIPIALNGFAAFAPRVIYINVDQTEPLLTLHQTLIEHLETTIALVDPKDKSRPYTPHMTVAFRDLTKQNFKVAWQTFKDRELYFEFTASHLTLLRHTGNWTIDQEFPFDGAKNQ